MRKAEHLRAAFDAMKQDLVGRNGSPAFEKENLLGRRLEGSEIALAHLRDSTTQASYWEKSYFARINKLTETGSTAKNSPRGQRRHRQPQISADGPRPAGLQACLSTGRNTSFSLRRGQ